MISFLMRDCRGRTRSDLKTVTAFATGTGRIQILPSAWTFEITQAPCIWVPLPSCYAREHSALLDFSIFVFILLLFTSSYLEFLHLFMGVLTSGLNWNVDILSISVSHARMSAMTSHSSYHFQSLFLFFSFLSLVCISLSFFCCPLSFFFFVQPIPVRVDSVRCGGVLD